MEHQIKCHPAELNQQAFSPLDCSFYWYQTIWISALKASVATTLTAPRPYVEQNEQATTNINSDPEYRPTWT
jgi:hypothetical protein